MQVYGFLLTGIILLLAIGLGLFTYENKRHSIEEELNTSLGQMENFIIAKDEVASNIYVDLVGMPQRLDNFRQYLNLKPADYFAYTEDIWQSTRQDLRFSNLLQNVYSNSFDLKALYLALEEAPYYITSSRNARTGSRVAMPLPKIAGLTVKRSILDNYSGQPIGQFIAVFDESSVLTSLKNTTGDFKTAALIIDSSGETLFTSEKMLTAQQEKIAEEAVLKDNDLPASLTKKYFVKRRIVQGQKTLLVLGDKKSFNRENFKDISSIFAGAGLLLFLLLYTLHRTFKRYWQQVSLIVEGTVNIGEGNLDAQIDLGKMQGELKDIGEAINFMTGSLHQYINDIYILEIKQKDAHMRALQSQINPHFLYNTLEYIRMYALSKNQEELADVVFAFSALLRNNTTQEKTTTIQRELSFCEKYVYLYQMRYPDQVAYDFKIAEKLKDLEIPKFAIQPLVENYFVHGIDYRRNDNAISVKVYEDNGEAVIQITDNGKGMTPEKLAEVRQKLAENTGLLTESIGLLNVAQRLENYFSNFSFEIESQLQKGTVIYLRIKQ